MERKYAGGDCCGLHRRRAYNRDTAINQGLSSQENSSIFPQPTTANRRFQRRPLIAGNLALVRSFPRETWVQSKAAEHIKSALKIYSCLQNGE